MQQSSGAMTWSEGVAALLTFCILMFLLWVYAGALAASGLANALGWLAAPAGHVLGRGMDGN